MSESVLLFSYGTLQQPEVQLANFGRLLGGRADAITGYRLEHLEIEDAAVVALSGKSTHLIAVCTNEPEERIEGTLFEMKREELDASDRYEVGAYKRTQVSLESGATAYAYVRGTTTQSSPRKDSGVANGRR